MMYSIKGTIVVLQEGMLCIENHGITWELCISLHAFQSLSPLHSDHIASGNVTLGNEQPMNETNIYTYLHANDKGMHLYGFYSLAERSVFLTLQKVAGIGPKAAIKILSHTTPELLMGFISNQDTKSLSKIPGIGAKKASAILLALEGVYISPQSTIEQEAVKKEISREVMGANADIINGLIKMGYEKNAIDRAIEYIKHETQDADMDEGLLMHNIIKRLES